MENKSTEPLVYIVLVNYNGYRDTVSCLQSLEKIRYSNYRIILVDNCSEDRDKITADPYISSRARVILAPANDGFSSGNNYGIREALQDGAEYVLLLNNDTEVTSDFLNILVETAQSDPAIGITTGNIYYHSKPDTLWYCAGAYDRHRGTTQMCTKNTQTGTEEVSFICGCLMLLRAEMLNRIGLLEEDFFLYSEDTELCCRAQDAGWKLVWNGSAAIYHKVSTSTGENSPLQQYYLIRNNLYMAKEYCEKPAFCYARRFLHSCKEILRGRYHLKPLLRAYQDFSRGIKGKSF